MTGTWKRKSQMSCCFTLRSRGSCQDSCMMCRRKCSYGNTVEWTAAVSLGHLFLESLVTALVGPETGMNDRIPAKLDTEFLRVAVREDNL